MNLAETQTLIRVIAAICPAQRFEADTALAWAEHLDETDPILARAALKRIGRRLRFIALADICEEVDAITRERLGPTGPWGDETRSALRTVEHHIGHDTATTLRTRILHGHIHRDDVTRAVKAYRAALPSTSHCAHETYGPCDDENCRTAIRAALDTALYTTRRALTA